MRTRPLPALGLLKTQPIRRSIGMPTRIVVFGLLMALVAEPARSSPEEWEHLLALEGRVRALQAAGKHREALPIARQLLAFSERVYGDHPKVIANALINLGNSCREQGLYAEAERVIKRALALRESVLDANDRLIADCLNNLAVVYQIQGRYKEAEPLYQRALAIREISRGVGHPDVAHSLNNLGALYQTQGRYIDAERFFKRALTIFETAQGAEHPNVAAGLNNLSNLYQEQGRFIEAERLCKRALEIRENALGADHPDVAASVNNLAILYGNQHRLADAESLYKRAIAISERLSGADHLNAAMSLNNLGNTYWEQGRFAEAEPLFRRALAINERFLGTEHLEVAMSLNGLANVYKDQGRFVEAESMYNRVLAIRQKILQADHPLVASALDNLAIVQKDQDKYAEAEPRFKQALAIREKTLPSDHPELIGTLNNLAILNVEQHRYAEAEQLHRRALAAHERALGAKHPLVAKSWDNLAIVAERQDRLAEAERLTQQAWEIFQAEGVEPELRFHNRYRMARLAWKQGRKDEAVADLSAALELAEEARSLGSGGEQERAGFFERFDGGYEDMVAWQRELAYPAEALAAAERRRARSLVDQMNAAHIDLLAGLPQAEADQLRAAESAAQASVADLEKQLELLPDRNDLLADQRQRRGKQLEAQLGPARQSVVDAFAAIRNASPAYRQLVGQNFKPATLDEIQNRLAGSDALVLEYYLGVDAGYVFVIPPLGQPARVETLSVDKEQAEKLGIDAGPLTAKRLQRGLSNEQGSGLLQQLRKPSHEALQLSAKLAALWQILVPATERGLLTTDKLKQLIVVPDGSLAMLPFDALVVEPGDDPKYLLDLGPKIIYAPSATLLINLTEKSKGPGPTLVKPEKALSIGNPNYGGPQPSGERGGTTMTARARYGSIRGSLQPLPFTAWECQWVAEMLKKSGVECGVLQKDSAREASVRRYAPGRGILHFACHGLVDQSYGNLFGSLALTPGPQGAADPNDDGFLTLAEIYALPLAGTELSILSACDTNLGPQQKGEGTWSLSRGFLVAGSRRVVASNWLVDDEAAASLVSVFCGAVAKGETSGNTDYATSLQAAKRWVRGQDKWKSPYYWGTFVLVGPQ